MTSTSIVLRNLGLGVLVTLGVQGMANAIDLENIVFESGSIGAAGTPAATGWEYFNTTGGNGPTAVIEDVPDRTFQTGTNSEAFVLHPWYFANDNSFGHGAEWNVGNDAGASSLTVEAGKIVYLQSEIFSDFAGGGQYWKVGTAVGFRGNGTDLVNRGFDTSGAIGDNDKPIHSAVEADWVPDHEFNFNGIILGSDKAQRQNNTRWPNPPETVDLDKTYVSTAIFRQGVDAATPFVGTETEVSEALDNKNGGESVATGTSAATEPWGGNTNVITGLVLDRAQINLLRGSGQSAPANPSRVEQHSSFIDPAETDPNSPLNITNAVLGIKMFRVGITDITDVNLDGVTDSLDKAIVMANLGAMADIDGLNGPTFFEGDINNDLVVDANDLAFFATPGDFNADGAVNAADYTVWRDNLGAPNEDALNGNGSNSGGVDAADYALWRSEYGNGDAGALQPASVPEPGAALLGVFALVGLAGGRTRSLVGRRD